VRRADCEMVPADAAAKDDPGARVPPPPPSARLRVVQALTVIAVVGGLAGAIYYREHLEELESYGYAAVFLVGVVSNATLILPVPGLAVSSALGAVFNPFLVGVVGGVGQALGELTGYLAGYSGQTWIDENRTYDRLAKWTQRHGTLAVFLLGLIPNPLFDLGGIAAGALRMPLWKFLGSCVAGKVIKNILFALGGDWIGSLSGL
jgi:uncharacterized membrane protein YdjX (TVP38/TMEM64 family)